MNHSESHCKVGLMMFGVRACNKNDMPITAIEHVQLGCHGAWRKWRGCFTVTFWVFPKYLNHLNLQTRWRMVRE